VLAASHLSYYLIEFIAFNFISLWWHSPCDALLDMRSKIAICQLHERVAPRFDRSPELVLVSIDDYGTVKEKKVFPTATLKPKEVVELLGRLEVTTLICGGVKEDSQQALKRVKIQFIDNVIGNVEDILIRYLEGKLKRGNTRGSHP